jgi:hypothetical protein
VTMVHGSSFKISKVMKCYALAGTLTTALRYRPKGIDALS